MYMYMDEYPGEMNHLTSVKLLDFFYRNSLYHSYKIKYRYIESWY